MQCSSPGRAELSEATNQPARCPSLCQQNYVQPHPYVCPAPCCPSVPMAVSVPQSNCTWQACSLQGNGKEPPLYYYIVVYQGSNLGLGHWDIPLHSQIFRQYIYVHMYIQKYFSRRFTTNKALLFFSVVHHRSSCNRKKA